jgi:hypothetical protein
MPVLADAAILAPAPPVLLVNDGAYPQVLLRPGPRQRRCGPSSRRRSPRVVTGQPGQVQDRAAPVIVKGQPHRPEGMAERV